MSASDTMVPTAGLQDDSDELAQTLALLQAVTAGTGDAVYVKDLEGRYIFANQATARFVGRSVAEISGKKDVDLFTPESALVIAEVDARVLRQGCPETTEEAVTADGIHRTFLVTKAPYRDSEGRVIGLIGVSRNISGRERVNGTVSENGAIETVLRHRLAELERRMEERIRAADEAIRELEMFSYAVSHDLRTPLRAVDGYSQALVEDFGSELPEEGQRYVATIRNGAQQMGLLIDGLLTFSRLSRKPLELRPIETIGLVQAVVAELQAGHLQRKIEVQIGDLPPCTGDPVLVRQVWSHLLSNAFKFTNLQKSPVVQIGGRVESGENLYFVRDNGTGFDMRYTNKLFGVFQRLHRTEDYEGTGVGLAIVQRIVHRHGGRVWAEAALHHGATFSFTLKTTNP